MAKRLTAVGINNLAPRPGEKYGYEVGDIEPGLKVWVSATGAKSFVVRYKTNGKGRKLTLGKVGDYSLQEARDFARETMPRARQGEDPAQEKRAKRAVLASASDIVAAPSVEQSLGRYISAKLASDADPKVRLKSGTEVERLLRREIMPFWTGRTMASITRDDVDLRIGAIRERAPVVANRTLANLRSACKWMVKNRIIPANPCDGVDLESDAEARRERVLSEAEVGLLIRASRRLTTPWAQMIHLMLLTGVRRGEAAGAHRGELHQFNGLHFWTVPAERTKNGKPLEIPLSGQLQSLFASLPEIGKQGLYFTTTGKLRYLASRA